MRGWVSILAVLALVGAAPAAVAAPDWFTRVKNDGLDRACADEVALYERGTLAASLHVGQCYFELGRWAEGVAVFEKLVRSPDRNYAALALARTGEGRFHLGDRDAARAIFSRCLKENPEAWVDGSVADLCRAWLAKLDGRLVSPEAPAEKGAAAPSRRMEVESVRSEIEELAEQIEELKRLLRELGGESPAPAPETSEEGR